MPKARIDIRPRYEGAYEVRILYTVGTHGGGMVVLFLKDENVLSLASGESKPDPPCSVGSHIRYPPTLARKKF